MKSESTFPLVRTARSAVAIASLLLTFTLPALAQDQTPPPGTDQTPPPAPDAATPPADVTPPTDATPPPAPETTETVPVKPLVPEQAAAPAPAKNATQLDTIEVTGSRLKRTDYESAQPVVSISREDIERSGQTDINEILRHLNVAGNNTVTPAINRDALSMGETNLDLRNLGAQHTLLLVNGRRWVTGLVPTQPNISDYNTIPTAIIERIEILKDGASAIYGSDAIGGVVNIITRKDYEGFGITYQGGQFFQQGDGENQQASANWGFVRPGTSMFINLSYTDQGKAYAKNRPFTSSPMPQAGFSRWSTNTERGRFTFVPNSANANFYMCPNIQGPVAAGVVADPTLSPILTDSKTVPAGAQLCTLQLIPGQPGGSLTDYRQTQDNNPEDHYNRYLRESLTQPNSRTALFGQYAQDLTDHVNFSFEALYNIRDSRGIQPNLTFNGGDAAFLTGANNSTGITTDNPTNPFGQGIGISQSHTPFEEGYGIWTMRLLDDRSNPTYHQTVHTTRLGGTFRGDLEVLSLPLSWDGGYIYARNKIQEILPLPRYDLLAQVVGNRYDPTTDTSTYDPTVCVSPCVLMDVFHGQAGFDYRAVTYATYNTWQRNSGGQDIGFLDVSGEIAQAARWLAGPIAVATGLELRRDQYQSYIDPVLQAGNLVQFNQEQDSGGRNYSREAYVEFGIPVLKDLPLAHVVDLDIAGRYSRYPAFGSITTGKAGLRWQPVDDLLARGTFSTGFRAPSIAELDLPGAQSGDPLSDPCASPTKTQTTQTNCVSDGAGTATGQINSPYALWQGDPHLKPEKSINITYGLVYSPHFIPDLNLSVDFYKISIDQYITIGGGLGQYFLDSCYTQARPAGAPANSGAYCSKVHRDQSGELTYVDVPFFNLGKLETSGVDFDIDYILPTPEAFGRFKVRLDAGYVDQFNQFTPQPGKADVVTGSVGTASGFFTSLPRWKASSEIVWKRDLWNASWSSHLAYQMMEPCNDLVYTPSYRSLGLCSDPKLDANGADISQNKLKTVVYHNLQIGRELPGMNADITLGVNNVLDQDPPYSYSVIGSVFWMNYDPTQYEIPGRFGYMRVGFKF